MSLHKGLELCGTMNERVEVLWQMERATPHRGRHRDADDGDEDTDSDASDNSATLFDSHQKLHNQRPRNAIKNKEIQCLVEYPKQDQASKSTRYVQRRSTDVGVQATGLDTHESRLENRIEHLERRLREEESRNKAWKVRMAEAEGNLQKLRNQITSIGLRTPSMTSERDGQNQFDQQSLRQIRCEQHSQKKIKNFGDADYKT